MLFNGFTEKSSEALAIALKKAMEMGHTYVGSEHILYGLAICRDSTAYIALEKCCVTESEITARMESLIGRGLPTKLNISDFSPRSKRILENAIALSKANYRQLAGTEHILRAILKDEECYATIFLKDIGVNTSMLYSYCTESIKKDYTNALKKENKKTTQAPSSILKYGKDLTELARNGKLDPCIGRDEELSRVIEILLRRQKNNPCLIGEPGVGKTAIAEGLAIKIVKNEVPSELLDRKIFSLDIASMLAGAKYRGDFEERIKNLLDEISKEDEYYLFIDEIHNIVGAGAAEGAIDAANIMKPLLARGDIHVIGATTINEYRKYIEKDSALERRFQSVMIKEPTVKDTIVILEGLKERYEKHHKITISDEAIEAAAELSERYISERFLPDKAIDLIDEAAASYRLKLSSSESLNKSCSLSLVKSLEVEKKKAVNNSDFQLALKIREKEKEVQSELQKMSDKNSCKIDDAVITGEDIAKVISRHTGIPVGKLESGKKDMLLSLEKQLSESVIGQEKAINALASAIRRGQVGFSDEKRPLGSFLFIGSTGVGKTECCKALAKVLFGSEKSYIRLDMSEYMEKHSVSKLIGAPAGYVGYEDGGQLTEKVRRTPYSVVVFDEIEKAHPDVCHILLQILEDGILTDSNGRGVNFKNTIIIMTGNIGSDVIGKRERILGFSSGEEKDIPETRIRAELLKFFRPEFLGRVDEIIVFNDLNEKNYKDITIKVLDELAIRCLKRKITVNFTENTISALCKSIVNSKSGAREIRKLVRENVEDLVALEFISGRIRDGDCIDVDYSENDGFKLNICVYEKT